MSSRLSGKVCIITGTGGSIGREAARTFARAGAQVVGCDVTVDAAQATVDMVGEKRIFAASGGGKIPFVDARDIAAVAAVTLTRSGHDGNK